MSSVGSEVIEGSRQSMPGERSTPHETVFDGLRGLAILLVLATHANVIYPGGKLGSLFASGLFGVQLFFVVSAATLTLASSRRRPLDLPGFFVRRIARIVPLYFLGVAFYLTVPVMPDQSHDPRAILLNLTFLHAFVPGYQNVVVPGGWSIGCEMAFYAAFPVLFWWATDRRRAAALVGLGCALNAILIALGRTRGWNASPSSGLYDQPIFQFTAFACGIAAFRFWESSPSPPRNTRVLKGVAAFALVLMLTLGMKMPTVVASVVESLLAGTLVYACASAPPRVLIHPLAVRLGLISYSVYIWHFAVIVGLLTRLPIGTAHRPGTPVATNEPASMLLSLVLTLALTWPLAEFSHRFIERPGMALGRRLLRRFRTG